MRRDKRPHDDRTRLVLTRKPGEVVRLLTRDGEIELTVLPDGSGNKRRLVFLAPPSVKIARGELTPQGPQSTPPEAA